MFQGGAKVVSAAYSCYTYGTPGQEPPHPVAEPASKGNIMPTRSYDTLASRLPAGAYRRHPPRAPGYFN